MAKLNLKSIFTNEQSYTVLQLLWKFSNEIDAWQVNGLELNSDSGEWRITYNGSPVRCSFADSAGTATQATQATQATMLLPDREYKCKYLHAKLTGDDAPILDHPESESWIYLKDDTTDDSDPVRYWNFVFKVGNLTKYLSKNIASGEFKGKTGVIMRKSFEELVKEAIANVIPQEFRTQSAIVADINSPRVADYASYGVAGMYDTGVYKFNAIGLNDYFLDYTRGAGFDPLGGNDYKLPNTLIITGTAWCANKKA